MNRDQINNEMKEMLGIVPSMFKSIPDSIIEEEWSLFKTFELAGGPISNKNRELMGIAISSQAKCKYCVHFHTEIAKLFGATDEEIETAIHYAKHTAGWSAYINGLAPDFNDFKEEIRQITDYVGKMLSESSKKKVAV